MTKLNKIEYDQAQRDFLDRCNFGALVLNENDDVVHICAYEHRPTRVDMQSLAEELATDHDFGLVGVSGLRLQVLEGPLWKNFINSVPPEYYDVKVDEGHEVKTDHGDEDGS